MPQNSQNSPSNKKSRAEKFDRTKKNEYLALLEDGKRRGTAARAVGVSLRTVQKHRIRYPSFAVEESLAEMDADDVVEDALYVNATENNNVVAQQVWLYNRRKDRWQNMNRQQRIQIVGGDKKEDAPVQIVSEGESVVYVTPTAEFTAEVIQILREAGVPIEGIDE